MTIGHRSSEWYNYNYLDSHSLNAESKYDFSSSTYHNTFIYQPHAPAHVDPSANQDYT